MEFGGLPADERAAGYRELARTHMKIAEAAEALELRVSHLQLASLWTRLAEEAERRVGESARGFASSDADPGPAPRA
jgi:hypothetical protein